MATYNVRVYNDMGHLVTDPGPRELPYEIYKFVCAQARQYLRNATDMSGLGCRFYVLHEGLQRTWTYKLKDDSITITWPTGEINPDKMRWLN
jgi:hypothetical protein